MHMIGANKDPIFALIERYCEAQRRSTEWITDDEMGQRMDALVAANDDVECATPTTVAGCIAKWRHFVRYERAFQLGDADDILRNMDAMLNELTALVEAKQ